MTKNMSSSLDLLYLRKKNLLYIKKAYCLLYVLEKFNNTANDLEADSLALWPRIS